jgi:formylglycine-generating enzyme required for sulfatase activity
MGANGDNDQKPVHTVSIKSFAIGRSAVTQGEWLSVMSGNPSNFKQCGASCPVENVSWNDAQEFVVKLNAKTGKSYRLPSESEWEYACRSGGTHQFCGNDNVDAVGWHGSNSGGSTHAIAGKQANAFGLYDMSGNVWQWVDDQYHANYNGAPRDGTAWVSGGEQKYKVLRGGSWYSDPTRLHSAFRNRNPADFTDYIIGFRLARNLSGP